MLKPGDPGYLAQNIGPRLYAITFTFLGLAVLVVLLRLYCRLVVFRTKSLLVADILIAVAIIVDIGMCLMIHMQIHTGMGRHIQYSQARPAMFRESMKVGLAENSLYQAALPIVKGSILTQLYPLALIGMQRKVLIGVGGFVVVFGLFTTFAAIFQCIPVSAAWDLATFPKGCWNMMAMNFFTSTVNTVVDVVIFILPLPVLLNLQLSRKRKVMLVASFCVGLIAITCSIIRLRNMVLFDGIGDFTYVAAMVPVWDAVEVNSGIICGSIPTLAPLIKRLGGSETIIQPGYVHSASAERRARNSEFQSPRPCRGNNSQDFAWIQMDSDSAEVCTHPDTSTLLSAKGPAMILEERISSV